jgi:hypothetical protein
MRGWLYDAVDEAAWQSYELYVFRGWRWAEWLGRVLYSLCEWLAPEEEWPE